MLDTRNNYSKIILWIVTVAMSALLVTVCLSKTYSTPSIIGLCAALCLLCIIGCFIQTTIIQHLRPLILFCSLLYFGFIVGGCSCFLFYFQGFILFFFGNPVYWFSFVVIIAILILSVIFGAIWCGWICWLGALQEFIFQNNRLNILKTKKAQKILFYIQIAASVALVIWVIFAKRPVLCTYDPFISIFRLKIFHWISYITVPLLLISSLFIYRPFCRILCPVGLLLYVVKYLPFAAKLKITDCTGCMKCKFYCKLNAIYDHNVEKTCNLCGECKKKICKSTIYL